MFGYMLWNEMTKKIMFGFVEFLQLWELTQNSGWGWEQVACYITKDSELVWMFPLWGFTALDSHFPAMWISIQANSVIVDW